MENKELLATVRERANKWMGNQYDAETRKKVKELLDGNETELVECFYRDLEFGTGGLRGIMGVGTNRMNVYTVAMATQGLSNYLKKEFSHIPQIKVAIAHDSRNNSKLFAKTTADIFSANGFKVYLFSDLRPTPELSFAIRYFKCQSGVVVTASHNPKEYNGYKAYWDDGGQIIAPHDKKIIEEVQSIQSPDDVNFNAKPENIEFIGDEIDDIYTNQITGLSLSHDVIKRQHDLKIVYTPLHGAGVKLVPQILQKYGFTNVIHVPEQDVSDGNFPTVISPNPEESSALELAVKKAQETNADIVLATDPDADRVGMVVKNKDGKFIIMNGNQSAALLINYLLSKWSANGKLKGREFIVKTIVTTELLAEIAKKYNVECYDVLTGFKYIADVIKHLEGKKSFIGGGEESYGYLAGDFVRDKDAIMSCALLAEAAAYAKDRGMTMYDQLLEIYREFGLYKEKLISVVKKGKTGAEEIQQMMKDFRSNPPAKINNSPLLEVMDYLDPKSLEKATRKNGGITIPKSDVLQFLTEDSTKISIRPSGTEPKIKFYFGVKGTLKNTEDFEKENAALDARVEAIIKDLKLR
ncbi:MAG TPA: phospho-sugar mutase [Bacteroidales bacterium]|nr:phospho-sugar mutase [Bacteroidales bacterium]